jgi:hypothetical protein
MGDLNDIEPAHHKKRTRQNKHQWNQELTGIEDSHRCTSIPIVKRYGGDLSGFSANGDLLPANAACDLWHVSPHGARGRIFMLLC